MKSYGGVYPKIIVTITVAFAIACLGAGCQYPATGQASAESIANRSPVGADTELDASTAPQSSAQRQDPSSARVAGPARPSLETTRSVQTDAIAPDLKPKVLAAVTPVPTPTPVPLAQWVMREEDLRTDIETALQETDWARDGLNRQEELVIDVLGSLTGSDHGLTLAEWLAMPFLDTVEAADHAALQALLSVRLNDPEAYRLIMEHDTIGNSITDQWTPIIAALPGTRQPTRGEYTVSASLVRQLLDPEAVTVEMATISLPLAGPVTVAVVRIGSGSEEGIQRLVHAIRAAEAFMQDPFPIKHVTMLFADWPEGAMVVALNNNHSLTIGAVLDVGDGDPLAPQSKYIIAHETAHFYWMGHHDWLDESASELIARAATMGDEDAYRPQWTCAHSEYTTEDLESLELPPEQPHYACNYALGLKRLADMESRMGSEDFMRWLRSQHRNQP